MLQDKISSYHLISVVKFKPSVIMKYLEYSVPLTDSFF